MATIVMESSKVIEAANNAINSILAKRIALTEKLIEDAMKPQKRLFRKPVILTRDQAVKYLEANSFEFYLRSEVYAGAALKYIKSLRLLAKNGGPVLLNENDIKVLFN